MFVLADLHDLTRLEDRPWRVTDPTVGPRIIVAHLAAFLFGEELSRAAAERDALLEELGAVLSAPGAFFADMGTAIAESYTRDWQEFQAQMAADTLTGRFKAGKIVGELLVDVLAILTGVVGAGRLAAKLASKIPRLLRLVRSAKLKPKLPRLRRTPGSGSTAPPARSSSRGTPGGSSASAPPAKPAPASPQKPAAPAAKPSATEGKPPVAEPARPEPKPAQDSPGAPATGTIARDGYTIDSKKFEYLFGEVEKPNPALETLDPKKYQQLQHNYDRSQQMKKVFADQGIENTPQGREKVLELMDRAAEGPEVSVHKGDFGTTVTRTTETPTVKYEVKYFYPEGDMTAKPKVTTLIPRVKK